MFKCLYGFIVLFFLPFVLGCSVVTEVGKTLWGSSIRPLEEARKSGESRIYQCAFDDAYDSILSMANDKDMEEKKGYYDVFQKDRVRGFIVIMGIDGSIDTTEVGIFIEEIDQISIKVDIASPSTSAKEKISGIVYKQLDLLCKDAE
ncbi:MAG: hypothetical protein HQL27_07625 [Candidatus Omnitrophica bacterium]|nr:hypothetical protein [Candidatus Omnitrophota bacterium]